MNGGGGGAGGGSHPPQPPPLSDIPVFSNNPVFDNGLGGGGDETISDKELEMVPLTISSSTYDDWDRSTMLPSDAFSPMPSLAINTNGALEGQGEGEGGGEGGARVAGGITHAAE